MLCKPQHLSLHLQQSFSAEEQALATISQLHQQGSTYLPGTTIISDGSSGSSSGGGGSSGRPGSCGAAQLLSWLVACLTVWHPYTELRPPARSSTAAVGAGACGMLQACCRLVQHAAQLHVQGAPPPLFLDSWSEGGTPLARLINIAVWIGAAWGREDPQPHSQAAMSAAPRS